MGLFDQPAQGEQITVIINAVGDHRIALISKASFMDENYLKFLASNLENQNIADKVIFSTNSDVEINSFPADVIVLGFENVTIENKNLVALIREISSLYIASNKRNLRAQVTDVTTTYDTPLEAFMQAINNNEKIVIKGKLPLNDDTINLLRPNKPQVRNDNHNTMPEYITKFDICPTVAVTILKGLWMEEYRNYLGMYFTNANQRYDSQGLSKEQLEQVLFTINEEIDRILPLCPNCMDCQGAC